MISWNWNETPSYDTPVRWHTGDPETDPWEWRIRVLDERDDIPLYSHSFTVLFGGHAGHGAEYFGKIRDITVPYVS